MEPARRPTLPPAGAGGTLLGVTLACIGVGALIGWLAGKTGIGILIGAVLGIPVAVYVVYRRYRESF